MQFYPTLEHEYAAKSIVNFFTSDYGIDAVLLTNSCARGRATRDSCLDMLVLLRPAEYKAQIDAMTLNWERFEKTDKAIQALKGAGKYSDIHLNFSDGAFIPTEQDEAAGPDSFELVVGNYMAYSVPLWQGSDYFSELKSHWLPYYDETLRLQRLSRVRHFCLNNLHHVPLYVKRGLYFQSFDRIYNAYQEFLQALFISHKTYPIAYNKWIREQVEEILGMPELYLQLPHLFEIKNFESSELIDKAEAVEVLLERYAPFNEISS